MSKTVYAATWVEKLASAWSAEDGASAESRCIIDKRLNITAPTLKGLIEAISKEFFMEIEEISLGEEHDGVRYINFSREETGDSGEPTEAEARLWEEGKLTLFLCDYSFTVEKRTVGPIGRKEFEEAGLKID